MENDDYDMAIGNKLGSWILEEMCYFDIQNALEDLDYFNEGQIYLIMQDFIYKNLPLQPCI